MEWSNGKHGALKQKWVPFDGRERSRKAGLEVSRKGLTKMTYINEKDNETISFIC